MKRLFIALFIVAGSLVATSAYSQVYVEARIGVPAAHRVYRPGPLASVVFGPAASIFHDGFHRRHDHDYYRERGWGNRRCR